ncbi:hypothetical protein AB870_12315 [Pandoraea faecigallinarum]|uniref:Effector protein BipC n=1 Tax=Pandoraea faecigallinarum TaxID=656179 RepID=A0A0H3WVT7_9BURK|nr:IpaC/SipC family type III secretion system effector [Pandoraea faecigallinarum]AKM30723.1 hypothetical protein AB870_12315 [Pandoraea faecigallinarum]
MNILDVSQTPVVLTPDAPGRPKDAPPPGILYNTFTPPLDDDGEDDPLRPMLQSPPPDASKKDALDWLKAQQPQEKDGNMPGKRDDDPGYGSPLSDDAVLIGKFFDYFQKAFQNGLEIRNKMAQVNFQSVVAAGEATKEAGKAYMWGGISSGLAQGMLGGMGAFKSLSGISKERNALKMRAPKPEAPVAAPQGAQVSGAPPTANAPDGRLSGAQVPGVDPDGTLDAAPPRPNAPDDAPDVTPPPVAADPSPAPVPDGPSAEALNLSARGDGAQGAAFSMMAAPAAGMLNGASQYSAALENQQQKLADSGAQLSRDGTTNAQDQANKDLGLVTEMLKAIDAVSQAKAGAASAIAGNLRG